MTRPNPDWGPVERLSTVVARVLDRLFVTVDGELVDGSMSEGGKAIICDSDLESAIKGPMKLAGGLPVKDVATFDEPPEEESARFRLCLDGPEHERPYSGWLGRLLVLENGRQPRLFALPHDPRYPGHSEAFGCFRVWGHEACRASARCKNQYGVQPCNAPKGHGCDGTYETCKDREDFAPCPLTFGEYPCAADPSDDPCQHSIRTCKALGKGEWPQYGDSPLAPFGLCNNTWSTCQAHRSFAPYCPEFHAYSQPRCDAPFELTLHAKHGRDYVWLGESQESVQHEAEGIARTFSIGRVWAAVNDSVRLPRTCPTTMIPTIPCSEMTDEMRGSETATGVGVADISYSVGAATGSSPTHFLASVQWVTSEDDEGHLPRIVVNRSPDGYDWSEDGAVFLSDVVSATYNEEQPTRPTYMERTEYRVPKVLPGGPGGPLTYYLAGRTTYHTEKTEEGGYRKLYDEMWIGLFCSGAECTFEPEIAFEGYINDWPAEPSEFINATTDFPARSLISRFSFRFAGDGWPTGVYEVIVHNGQYNLFIPASLVLAHRPGIGGFEPVTVPVLMRYQSSDGVSYRDGTIVKDHSGRFMACTHSVPVCRSWNGSSCVRRDGFCGIAGPNGEFRSIYPKCDGQGTGAAADGSKWSRYVPSSSFVAPSGFGREAVRGDGPPYALAGCDQRGAFACRLKKEPYQGQWCARPECSGFEPRPLWGADGIRAVSIRSDEL